MSNSDAPFDIDPSAATLLSDLPADASCNDIKTRMGLIRLSQAQMHGNATYAAKILQHAFAETKQSQNFHELLGEQLRSLERRLAQTADDDEAVKSNGSNDSSKGTSANGAVGDKTESSNGISRDEDDGPDEKNQEIAGVSPDVLGQHLLEQIANIRADQKHLGEKEILLRDRLRSLEKFVKETLPGNSNLQDAIAASREYTTASQMIECVVCSNRSAERAVIPCGHLCLCEECTRVLVSSSSSHLQYCPLCRGSLLSTLRIYTAK